MNRHNNQTTVNNPIFKEPITGVATVRIRRNYCLQCARQDEEIDDFKAPSSIYEDHCKEDKNNHRTEMRLTKRCKTNISAKKTLSLNT